jgi:hypothetical protein
MDKAILLITAGLVSAWATSAHAFQCSRAEVDGRRVGPSLSWFTRELSFTFFAAGTRTIADDQERDVVRAAFQTWEGVTTCGAPTRTADVSFTEVPPSVVDRIGYDFDVPEQTENLIIFRDDGWPLVDKPQTLALTTVTYSRQTGEILDADIEFNTSEFVFTVGDTSIENDLLNTAVHEVGHFVGVGHTTLVAATMYGESSAGETLKRDLDCDDRQAVAFKYPVGESNGYCGLTEPGCGECVGPEPLRDVPNVTPVSFDDGMTPGCATAPPLLLATLTALVGILRVRTTNRLRRS